jgi:Type I phosphodiesterase / nucleotide pyrophosphatase
MRRRRKFGLGALALTFLVATGLAAAQTGANGQSTARPSAAAASDCQLKSAKGDIAHVIYIIFDNVHFLRDDPNVPSDLEQMPHLLDFMRSNGSFLTNNHTILISHTAGGILTSFTGLYPDRHGQAVTNSYRYFFGPNQTTASSTSFKYWTDLVDDTNIPPRDPLPNMVTGDSGTPKNTPAPWVPYTRAGCDFGAVASANIVLENTGTGPNGDMTKVFGAGSPEWLEAQASNMAPPNTAARALAQTDFVGMAIHCATDGGICAGNPKARPDLLPDEPGGYDNYLGLFGTKYINPLLTGSAVVHDLHGNPITDPFDQPGFPGFDGLFASTTLAYVAEMQEAGIPVTFGYISDAHDNHGKAGNIHISYGPGEPGYVAQLKRYDEAFAMFFDRLAADGITKDNTLFVFTVEEGDRFVGSAPTPAGCDGVSTPCSYSQIGEINGNLRGLLETQEVITTPFTVHSDMAPTVYLEGNPSRTARVTREFERAVGRLQTVSPYTGQTDNLTIALADPVAMKTLHMITADPQRTPTFTMFADPDYFLFASSAVCGKPSTPSCVFVPPPSNFTFAWNHGGIEPEIAATWLGMVGPGVRNLGQDDDTWADHVDHRPTMLTLLGLEDTYIHDGRVLIDQLDAWAVPQTLRAHRETLRRLGEVYKQLNAPFGTFAMDTLVASTRALRSGSASNDNTYTTIEGQIESLTSARDALASQIRAALHGATFEEAALDEQQAKGYIRQAQSLIGQAKALAASS